MRFAVFYANGDLSSAIHFVEATDRLAAETIVQRERGGGDEDSVCIVAVYTAGELRRLATELDTQRPDFV